MTDPTLTSRRRLLVTGGLGAAAAALLAACSDIETAGSSGDPAVTTEVPPTVPVTEPSAEALELDQTLLRTAASLELLAAEAYETYGPTLSTPELQTAVAAFGSAHTDNASVFNDAADKPVEGANEIVRDKLVTPLIPLLDDDAAILGLFGDLESTIAATYAAAAGSFTTPQWRATVAAHAGAAAGRVGVLGHDGTGTAPTDALYPSRDLISQGDYMLNTPATTAPAE